MIEIIRPSDQSKENLENELVLVTRAHLEAKQRAKAEAEQRRHSETVAQAGVIAAKLGRRTFRHNTYEYDSDWLDGPVTPDGDTVQLRTLRIDSVNKRICGIPVQRKLASIHVYVRLCKKHITWPDGRTVAGTAEFPVRFIASSEDGPAMVQLADRQSTDMSDLEFIQVETTEQWSQVDSLLKSLDEHADTVRG